MKTLSESREKAIVQISWLMLAFLLLSTVANALQGRFDFVILYLVALAATALHLLALYRRRDYDMAAESLMSTLFVTFFMFFLIGEHRTFDVLWVLVLPAVAVIVGKAQRTRVWIIRFLVILGGMVALKTACAACLPYEGFALWSLLWAGIFLSGMALYYKKIQSLLEAKVVEYQSGLEHRIADAVAEIKGLNADLEATQWEILQRLGTLGEYRSTETGMHVRRVGLYTKTLARLAGRSEPECELLERAAPLHDIGKVGIEDSILNKPGKLTDTEFERMQCHTLIGEAILAHSDKALLQLAGEIAGGHHEKYDGSGYPRKRAGDAIPFSARVTAVADVFDALYSKRVYKKGWSKAEVIDYFNAQRGRHFDPVLVDLFLGHIDSFIAIFNAHKDTPQPEEVPCVHGS